MAYEKQIWEDGNGMLINAERLNHIENGIEQAANNGGGVFNVTIIYSDEGEPNADKTFDEIFEAVQSGKAVFARIMGGTDDLINIRVFPLNYIAKEDSSDWGYATFVDWGIDTESNTIVHLEISMGRDGKIILNEYSGDSGDSAPPV